MPIKITMGNHLPDWLLKAKQLAIPNTEEADRNLNSYTADEKAKWYFLRQ